MAGKEVVKAGYEAIADAYARDRVETSEDVRLLGDFIARVDRGGRVLDAGCGAGKPVAQILSRQFRVVGVDLAWAQLRLLRDRVPPADPVQGDMTHLPFQGESFDGIASFYAIIHVPREEHRAMIGEFHRILRTSGIALLCMGDTDLPGRIEGYMGTPMFWSHFNGGTNRSILTDSGLRVIWERVVVDFQNPSATHRFFLVVKS